MRRLLWPVMLAVLVGCAQTPFTAEGIAKALEAVGRAAKADEVGDYRRAAEAQRGIVNTTTLFSTKDVAWETPPLFFDLLDARFNFTVDVCATAATAKCERYFSPEDDGLAQTWKGTCWMNPPYGRMIGAWLKKAYIESRKPGTIVVCLIPSRTDTTWWHDYVMKAAEVWFCQGRLRFVGATSGAPFPSAVVVFRAECTIPMFSSLPFKAIKQSVWWNTGGA